MKDSRKRRHWIHEYQKRWFESSRSAGTICGMISELPKDKIEFVLDYCVFKLGYKATYQIINEVRVNGKRN